MTFSDDLFELIRSLGSNEKRYFKLFASRHTAGTSNKYIELFDAIDRVENYDEKELLKKYSKATFAKNFTFNKHYLHQLVLRSLNSFHYKSSKDFELREQLCTIEVLYNKGLYAQCEKLIDKAISFAENHDLYPYIVEILRWKRFIWIRTSYVGTSEKDLTEVFQKMDNNLKMMANINEYEYLGDKLRYQGEKYGFVKNNKLKKKVKSILSHPLLKDEKKAICYKSKMMFYNLYAFYYNQSAQDPVMTDYYLNKGLQLAESSPEEIKKDPMRYVSLLRNSLITSIRLKDYKKYDTVMRKIKKMESTKLSLTDEAFLFELLTTEMDFYIETGQFERIKEHIDYAEKGLKKFSKTIRKGASINIYLNIAYMYFGIKEYRKSLFWINNILNDKEGIKENIVQISKILELIIHYELKNFDLIPYLTRSTYRFLFKREKLMKFDKAIINFIRKTPPTLTSKELIMAFSFLKSEIEIIFKDPLERQVLRLFDIVSWLESKIKNKPFSEIVKQKASLEWH